MRRRTRGLLAALGLGLAACSGQGPDRTTADAAPSDDAAPGVDTSLAVASRNIPDTPPARAASFTVLVTSPEGVDAAGLDAAVSTLVGRADTAVHVVAPGADARDLAERSTPAPKPVATQTMTGHPADAVNGSMGQVMAFALAEGPAFDLVIVGISAASGIDEAAAALHAAALASDAGLPSLVVLVDGEDPDLAGASLLLSSVLDFDLDRVVDTAGIHTLTVPSCDSGIVRGPVVTDPTPAGEAVPPADCSSHTTHAFDDEAEALAAGVAALVAR